MKLGDFIEILAKPIAKLIGLKPHCRKCRERKRKLNRLHTRIANFFKGKPPEESECAKRHRVLDEMQAAGLLKHENGVWYVKKFK